MEKVNRRLKVLSVYWGFALGGGVRHACALHDMANRFPIHLVHVCIHSKKWESDTDSLARINAENIFITSRLDCRWVQKLVSVIKRYSPDAIMTHGFNGHFAVLSASFFIRNFNIPLICSYHGRYHPPQKNRIIISGVLNAFTEYFIRVKAVSAMTVSEFSKNTLVAKGVDPDKVSVVYNGLHPNASVSEFSRVRLRRNWGVGENDLLLGIVSRLDEIKGIGFLLQALVLSKISELPLRLVIIGTGPAEDALKKDVCRYGLEGKVLFVGKRSDIDDCLEAIDVFTLPSLEENHSIALLEAMRSSKTIIASDVGGNGESVRNDKEALLVPSRNANALANAIDIVYNNRNFSEQLGKRAYKRFYEKFSIHNIEIDMYSWIKNSI